jgi:hypothetical protein
MKATKAAQSTKNASRKVPGLAVRYGEIGISAVAAAMRYQSDVKDPAEAPTGRQLDRWTTEQRPELAA